MTLENYLKNYVWISVFEQYINQILQNRVNRPDSVEQLGKLYGHNYYTQNNRYYFYSLDNKDKVLYQTDKVYQLRSINSYKLVILQMIQGLCL